MLGKGGIERAECDVSGSVELCDSTTRFDSQCEVHRSLIRCTVRNGVKRRAEGQTKQGGKKKQSRSKISQG